MKYTGWEPSRKLCLVTAYTPEGDWNELGALTSETKMRYCEHWGHSLRVYTEGFDATRHPSWSKLLFVKDALKDYEWVFWSDVDAAITNMTFDLEAQARTELVVGSDANGICCAAFLLKRGEFADWFLEEVWGMTKYLNHGWWEQGAVRELNDRDKLHGKITIAPARMLVSNHVMSNPRLRWLPGDFMAHCCSTDVLVKDRIDMLRGIIGGVRTISSVG